MFNIKAFLGLAYFESELDQFLHDFDRQHPGLSASQRREKQKYERIYKLRDNANASTSQPKSSLWEEF